MKAPPVLLLRLSGSADPLNYMIQEGNFWNFFVDNWWGGKGQIQGAVNVVPELVTNFISSGIMEQQIVLTFCFADSS